NDGSPRCNAAFTAPRTLSSAASALAVVPPSSWTIRWTISAFLIVGGSSSCPVLPCPGASVRPGALSPASPLPCGEAWASVALRAAYQRVEPSLAQPGAEHDLSARGQGDPDILVVVTARGEREVVKEGERLLHERRELRWVDPGREVVQEALQRVLVRLDGRAVQGALEQGGDKLDHQRVVGGRARLPSWVSLRQ